MSESLVAKLDNLHERVSVMTRSLVDSRFAEKKAREQADALAKENERLRKKLEQAQGQINQMINQWFPELELRTEEQHGDA